MTGRQNIYYWKCDNPQSLEEKKQSYFKDKYNAKMEEIVKSTFSNFRNESPQSIKPVDCDGNHYAYFVDYSDKRYFFRAASGTCDDDYMLAESKLIELARGHEIPAPLIHKTEVDTSKDGICYQIMDCIPESCLNTYHKNSQLNTQQIAKQLGQLLQKLHSIKLDRFGFIDTEKLKETGTVSGLKNSYMDYFETCMDKHIEYVYDHNLVDDDTLTDITNIFCEYSHLLDLKQGSLIHRDPALWNILGTPDKITALIDWDDAISGDPADDLGMLYCFYNDSFMDAVIAGYNNGKPLTAEFNQRIWLHCLRNMLWKMMIRHYMGYFEKDKDFFLNNDSHKCSLKEYSTNKIKQAIIMLK